MPPKTSAEGDITFPLGAVDVAKLSSWIDQAREKVKKSDRLEVADSTIGGILAYAPIGADGAWPSEPIRDVIERIASTELEHGIAIGVHNKRGVHFVEPGGRQELRLAQKFRDYGEVVRAKWPRTGQLLAGIAVDYERQAAGNIERERFEEFE